jgi:hypothetical protein
MKRFRVFVFVLLAACMAAPAWAQYGLYGAPDMLRLPPAQPSSSAGTTVAPMAYQGEPAPQGMAANNTYTLVPADPSQPTAMADAGTGTMPPMPAEQPRPVGPPLSPTPIPPGPVAPGAGNLPCYTPNYLGSGAGCGCNTGSGSSCCGLPGCGWDGCNPCNGCSWYGSVLGLAMTRDRANKLWLASLGGGTANQACQLMNTQDASAGWAGGGEVTFGRYFCCNQCSVEATFWTLSEMTGCASVSAEPFVATPLTAGLMTFNNIGANEWFSDATCQTLKRTDEFDDLELNLVRHHLLCECGCPLCVDVLAGVRFFRFRDNLVWGADSLDYDTWAFVRDQTTNNLIGAQIGFNVEYRLWNRLRLFVTPKIGIFDNYVTNDFRANMIDGSGNSVNAVCTTYNMTYPVESHGNIFSVLSQIDVGLDWQISQRLSARLGYRLVAVTGVALADNQIPPYLNDIPAIQDIDRNGSLLVHGAFAGLTYCF